MEDEETTEVYMTHARRG